MNYTKPEIHGLGDAANVIQGTQIKDPNLGTVFDPSDPLSPFIAAYDLDE